MDDAGGVRTRTRGSGLPDQSRIGLFAAHEIRANELQCDAAVERDVLREEHDAHTARAEHGQDPIMRDLFADHGVNHFPGWRSQIWLEIWTASETTRVCASLVTANGWFRPLSRIGSVSGAPPSIGTTRIA